MHNITVTVDEKRRASSPREAFIIADNNDWGVTFEIDAASGFDTSAVITAVLVTARGKLPDITFSAGQITLPRLIEEDGTLLYIGLTQGNIKTTGWACVRIQQSIYSKAHGRTAPDPENPPDYDALPTAESVSMEDEVIITDVSAGRRERATLQLLSDLFGAESGHSPYIGANGHWYEWNSDAAEYVDTGTPAQGPQGADGAPGADGADGASAYEIAVAQGYTGSEAEWLASLKGDTGPQGPRGEEGPQGPPGDSDFAKIDLGDDFVTIQSHYAAGMTLIFNDSGRVGLMYDGESNRFYSFIVYTGAGYQIFTCTNGATPEWTTETVHLPASVNGKTGAVVLDAEDVGAQTPFLTTTLTIAVSDWNNGSCTKTVTGMTADALVFVKYSDTETEFTETQGTNSMTFTATTTPSEAVTVDVAWFKEVANT